MEFTFKLIDNNSAPGSAHSRADVQMGRPPSGPPVDKLMSEPSSRRLVLLGTRTAATRT